MSAIAVSSSDAVAVDRVLVQSLAKEYGRTEHDVEAIMREELGRLAAHARINTYLTVLATSSVRVRLRGEHAAVD